jgi:predicted house-cleaning noncanonical NTP pyrophosphatase (MazG superfamily)
MRTVRRTLIRDRVPERLDADGARYEVAELDDAAFRRALRAKLREAADAVGAAASEDLAGELADLLEVIEALIVADAVDPNAVGAAQRASRAAHGGFARRLELRWVERG